MITVKNIGDARLHRAYSNLPIRSALGMPERDRGRRRRELGTIAPRLATARAGIAVNHVDRMHDSRSARSTQTGNFLPLLPASDRTRTFRKTWGTWQGSQFLNNCASVVPASEGRHRALSETRQDCADVKLDPFAVQVAKTGDQSCQQGGECRFDLDIFDPGPIPHHAPVTVTDKLSGLSSAEIVSITPAAGADSFPCKPAPTKIPFTCTGTWSSRSASTTTTRWSSACPRTPT